MKEFMKTDERGLTLEELEKMVNSYHYKMPEVPKDPEYWMNKYGSEDGSWTKDAWDRAVLETWGSETMTDEEFVKALRYIFTSKDEILRTTSAVFRMIDAEGKG